MPNESTKTITLSLSEYLSDINIHQQYNKVVVPIERGILISEIDKDEQYCHVEFTENERSKEIAIVWDIKYWRESYERNERQRIASETRRQQYYLDDHNIKIVCKALAKKTGIKDAELMKPLAVKIIKEQLFETLPFLDIKDLKVKV